MDLGGAGSGRKTKTDACTRRCGVARPKGPAKIGIDTTSSFLHGKAAYSEMICSGSQHSSLETMLSRLATEWYAVGSKDVATSLFAAKATTLLCSPASCSREVRARACAQNEH